MGHNSIEKEYLISRSNIHLKALVKEEKQSQS